MERGTVRDKFLAQEINTMGSKLNRSILSRALTMGTPCLHQREQIVFLIKEKKKRKKERRSCMPGNMRLLWEFQVLCPKTYLPLSSLQVPLVSIGLIINC